MNADAVEARMRGYQARVQAVLDAALPAADLVFQPRLRSEIPKIGTLVVFPQPVCLAATLAVRFSVPANHPSAGQPSGPA